MLNFKPQESQKPALGIFIKISVKDSTMEALFSLLPPLLELSPHLIIFINYSKTKTTDRPNNQGAV